MRSTNTTRSRIRRRAPRPTEVRELLRLKEFRWSATDRLLARAASIPDLREAARRRVPRAVFDYVDGAAESESSLRASREAFAQVEFRPRVLRDVSQVDLTTSMFGATCALPLVFGPTGFTRMMNHEGEPAVAAVADRFSIPYVLSTLGTTSPEALAEAVPHGHNWFQLYVWRDRAASTDLLQRVRESGYRVLVLTVDAPVAGARLRDVRNGLTVPPALTLRTMLDGARHPAWWVNLLTTEPLRFAALSHWQGTVGELMNKTLDPAVTLDDLGWLREQWAGPIVVKGVQSTEDARAVVKAGADGIVLSNHGGRQLDRSPVPLRELPRVLDAIGAAAEVHVDGGVLSGADVIAAVALGARSCWVGRGYLYGLMAGGERGVQRAATLISDEMFRTMRLLGISRLADLTPDSIRSDPARR